MAGYDLKIRIKVKHTSLAKDFLKFINNVGKKYPVFVKYQNYRPGRFSLLVEGSPGGKIDALLQELILNRGLYYYTSALNIPNKLAVIREVILPIYQILIESRFPVSYSRYLRRHILGKLPQGSFIPGEFIEPSAHKFEVMFRKWDIGIIDDWNFIKDADSLITNFLLKKSGHIPGQRSPNFPYLLNYVYQKGIGMEKEFKRMFEKIHDARAGGLHRLSHSLNHDQLYEIATRVYIYFQFFNDFDISQKEKTVVLRGKRFKRIKYGYEKWDEDGSIGSDGKPMLWSEITQRPCHDCAAVKGQYHCDGCDVEQCPNCGGQMISYDCAIQSDFR